MQAYHIMCRLGRHLNTWLGAHELLLPKINSTQDLFGITF